MDSRGGWKQKEGVRKLLLRDGTETGAKSGNLFTRKNPQRRASKPHAASCYESTEY